ncbi:MAG: UDP-N-acetylmuramoyl-L-alanyl-D-glutamate--2,6-diaminopimelate ligase [Planctomycetota bacterium]|nr:UDP-N-acetylmuramoyl-L-alanyl-D-glutamate--2,6-diaminopimelate ligase [Planctomycetota bacterium]
MLLHMLLRRFSPEISLAGLADVEVRGVREDSRQVRPGDLFIARAGTKTDGRRFVADAKTRGAVAVVTSEPMDAPPLPQVVVTDASSAASGLAQLLLGEPSKAMQMLGITGTNGKTTTTYLIRHILASVNRRCGVIGTVEIDDGQTHREANMTTPGGIELAELLAAMRDNGCAVCAMEVSSHALDQGRVSSIQFAGAAFTNLTGDHLDYHKTMENYAAAKARLFESLAPTAAAIVNANDPWSERIAQDCSARVIRFGLGSQGDYRAKDIVSSPQGSRFTLIAPDGQAPVAMQLIGLHNIANALTAAALAGEVCDLSVEQIASALADAEGAPGRLQAVRCGQPFTVLVDYAHTDDALANVLKALRPLTGNTLRVLFGCGGDRDRTKRPRMAAVAERLADVVYLTSDNPRTENPQAIIDELVSGLSADVERVGGARFVAPSPSATGKRTAVLVDVDRRSAIERALADAQEGDVVLLAGKGHENYQIIGTEKRHFDDVEEATRVLTSPMAAA